MRSDSPRREDRGVQQDRQIHEKVSMLDVIEVVFDVLVNQVVAVTTELPESSDPWFYLQTLRMTFGVGLDDEGHFGTRSNQRHVVQEHIQYLRKLIQTSAPEEAHVPRHPAIACILRTL